MSVLNTYITDFKDIDLNGVYTYADYLRWHFQERVELIKGRIFKMSPAPSLYHQRISMNVARVVSNYFFKRPCQVFAAPFDVRLYDKRKSERRNQEIYTVVQPDICVICDKEKLDEQGCNGAPDWIIEIISPASVRLDAQIKRDLYEQNGVREYWVVYPRDAVVYQYILTEADSYGEPTIFTREDTMQVGIFPDLAMEMEDIFAE